MKIICVITTAFGLIFAAGSMSVGAAPARAIFSTFHVSNSAATPAGTASGGISVSLQGPSSATLGSAVRLTVEVRNVSRTVQRLHFPWMPCSYTFRVKNIGTAVVHEYAPQDCDIYNVSPTIITPGQSTFLTFSAPVADMFRSTGTFSIRVAEVARYADSSRTLRLAAVSSNAIAIAVQS